MRYTTTIPNGVSEPVTQAELAERLRLLPVTTDEAAYTITPLITAAREYCEARTGYAFIRQRVTAFPTAEDLNGGFFYLPRVPVAEIDSVKTHAPDGSFEEITDYEFDTEGAMRIGAAIDWNGLRKINPISITYLAGDLVCPASAKQAMLLLIGHWYANRESVQAGAVTAVEIAQTTDALLRLYRRWW